MIEIRSERESGWVRFGAFEVNPREREVLRRGAKLRLQAQPLSILLYLIEYAGQLVTREQLRQQLWPAGTYVDFERGLTVAVHKLRLSLDDPASNPRFIETVPGCGYRLIAPIMTRGPHDHYVRRPRILVLPFSSIGETTGLDLFADGLTEELIAQLTRFAAQDLDIVARAAVTPHPSTGMNSLMAARQAGASHVLEGRVRSAGGACRINVRLTQVSGETHLWADSFDYRSADMIGAEIEIADKATAAVLGILLPPPLSSDRSLRSDTSGESSLSN